MEIFSMARVNKYTLVLYELLSSKLGTDTAC